MKQSSSFKNLTSSFSKILFMVLSLFLGIANDSLADLWADIPPCASIKQGITNQPIQCQQTKKIDGEEPKYPPQIDDEVPKVPRCNEQVSITPTDRQFYVYHEGNDLKREGGALWESVPKQAANASAIATNFFYAALDDHNNNNFTIKIVFDFDRFQKEAGIAVDDPMTMFILSKSGCWGENKPCNPTYNLSKYNRLTFWAKTDIDEGVTISASVALIKSCFGDSSEAGFITEKKTLNTKWQPISLPINGNEMQKVINLFSITAYPLATSPKTRIRIYLDDIYYYYE
ncbi:MAG: hypothetical protein WCG16_10300 [Methylococcales bacterium]